MTFFEEYKFYNFQRIVLLNFETENHEDSGQSMGGGRFFCSAQGTEMAYNALVIIILAHLSLYKKSKTKL